MKRGDLQPGIPDAEVVGPTEYPNAWIGKRVRDEWGYVQAALWHQGIVSTFDTDEHGVERLLFKVRGRPFFVEER